MLKFLFYLFFLSLPITTFALDADCPLYPYFLPKTGPLAIVNCDFNMQYENRLQQLRATFGEPEGRPVILNLGGTLLFKYQGKTETVAINPEAFHLLKAYAHGAFSVYLVLAQAPIGVQRPEIAEKLKLIHLHLQEALNILPNLQLTPQQQIVIKKMTELTIEFLNRLQTKNIYTQQELNEFYQALFPFLSQSIKMCAELEIKALDAAMNNWLARMTKDEKQKLAIVVATSHQARAQEISLQYFAKKFGLHFGEGAYSEKNILVLEDKFDENSALQLLARHLLDREAANVILKDPIRLQRDLLADAAKEILQTMDTGT